MPKYYPCIVYHSLLHLSIPYGRILSRDEASPDIPNNTIQGGNFYDKRKERRDYSGDEQPARTACRERAAKSLNNRPARKGRNADDKGVYRGGQGVERVHCAAAYRPQGNPLNQNGTRQAWEDTCAESGSASLLCRRIRCAVFCSSFCAMMNKNEGSKENEDT